jgi:GWxTD domain-containing protein
MAGPKMGPSLYSSRVSSTIQLGQEETVKRSALSSISLVGLGLLWILAQGAAEAPSGGAARERIARLERELGRTRNPDSVKYALAIAHREAGTIEDRYRALEILNEIRRTYDSDPEFHWEWARTYEASARYMDARLALEQVLERRPGDVEARVQIARLLLRQLLYGYDLSITRSIREWLTEALDLDPDHRGALFLMSLTLHLARGLEDEDPPALTHEGKRCAERILARDPSDLDARFLLAIHCLDLDEVNLADRHFDRCLEAAPPEIQQALLSSELTAPARAIEYVRTLDSQSRQGFHRAYWRHHDPTPLTIVNENQLEFLKRMALAHFFFGDPRGGTPGWETDPGRALVRYGAPERRHFDPGSVTGTAGGIESLKPSEGINPYIVGEGTEGYRATLKFQPPSWSWDYRFRDVSFTLRFEDRNLSGDFYADDNSAAAMVTLKRAAPVVFHEASPGAIGNLYLASAGIAGREGTVAQSVHVGLPPWRDDRKTDWLEDSRMEVLIRDSTYTKVSRSRQRIQPDNIYRPFPGTELLLFSRKYDLAPGKYTVTAYIQDEDSGRHGVFTRPLVVRDYERSTQLEISDLELALAIAPDMKGPKVTRMGRSYLPNPMGLVGDDRNLDVLYELYHLASRGGMASYMARYTVLPLDYVVGFDYHVSRGEAAREDLVAFASSGLAIGGVALGPGNYSDVTFPKETVELARGKRMVKGARVNVEGLDPGKYVLVVTVTDAFSQASVFTQIPFQILTDEGLRELLTFRAPR